MTTLMIEIGSDGNHCGLCIYADNPHGAPICVLFSAGRRCVLRQDVDGWPLRCRECVAAEQSAAALVAERDRLAAELARLRSARAQYDCRYTQGSVADISGSHCPPDDPCVRCRFERTEATFDHLVSQLAKRDDELARRDAAEGGTVQEILVAHLRARGYDGLFNDDRACGCTVEDFATCGDIWTNCQPGYRIPCQCGEGCDFDIGPKSADADWERIERMSDAEVMEELGPEGVAAARRCAEYARKLIAARALLTPTPAGDGAGEGGR